MAETAPFRGGFFVLYGRIECFFDNLASRVFYYYAK